MEGNIQKYQALVKTVELGSFTKAAQVLNYSQSGISRMVNDLERENGVQLLVRHRSGLRLTSDGEKVYPFVQQLVNTYQQLSQRFDEVAGLQTGMIRIGTFSSVATHWLLEFTCFFQCSKLSI